MHVPLGTLLTLDSLFSFLSMVDLSPLSDFDSPKLRQMAEDDTTETNKARPKEKSFRRFGIMGTFPSQMCMLHMPYAQMLAYELH